MTGRCYHCGEVSTRMKCRQCWRKDINGLPYCCATRRAWANTARYRRYPDYCDRHGVTQFLSLTGECAKCSPAPVTNPHAHAPRVDARRAGDARYYATCGVHGLALFWTQQGKCCGCYHQNGTPRAEPKTTPEVLRGLRPGRPPLNTERAAARRRGESAYPAICDIHGANAFWVLSGKCCACAHESGASRKTQNRRAKRGLTAPSNSLG